MTFTEDENGKLIRVHFGDNDLTENYKNPVKMTFDELMNDVYYHNINGKKYKFIRESKKREIINKYGDRIIDTIKTWKISNEDKKEIEQYLEEKKKKFSNFKIKMIAIPHLTQRFNLARILPKNEWNKIRQETKEKYENKCGICGKSDVRLNCHEIWEFDDVNLIQTLKECISLCTLCHIGIHPTSALFESEKGYINLETIIEHFMKINECDKETYDEYKTYNIELQLYRIEKGYSNNNIIWKMNYGKYESLVKDKCGNINEKIDPLGLCDPETINTTDNLDDVDYDYSKNRKFPHNFKEVLLT